MTIAFDLDDTLYQEIEFVRSAYRRICGQDNHRLLSQMMEAKTPAEAFDLACESIADLNIQTTLNIYRNQLPDIVLDARVKGLLEWMKLEILNLALITDGRSITQRNKIRALGLNDYFSDEAIFISEECGHDKTDEYSFLRLMNQHPGDSYIYIGDNPQKDFLIPNKLGWTTVCLRDKGENIHSQCFNKLSCEYLPQIIIDDLSQLHQIIDDINIKNNGIIK
ncbi:MAG: HAD family hydrolase [Lachnoclostridium sp.]|nr:HAD family hydrolase [Lachnoclostridium sp.]